MEAGAWVGPAGNRFDQAVHGYQRELHAMLTQAVALARDELSRAK
ncbi:hypothetical protein OUY22_01185 [Nonomuraea sp. MCN248]|uniref:WXG100 family type VII secretion target n=1 Tax=Nonomuraea corallina TaxID=2989783 RepID=A0ABT4S491_9ACTN|nr:hypothetical protein [Nonomuraea corallina]MDA0632012.1 hypothetical protein [Nonomuraea corallina]